MRTETHDSLSQNQPCFKKSEAEGELMWAIHSVLRRKRSEMSELQVKYEAGCREKGGPVKGLGSQIEKLRQEISTLEVALSCLNEIEANT